MHEVFTQAHFSAAHRLVDYEGDCARWHGHNWVVKASVQARELDALGIAVDLRKVRQELLRLLDQLDHTELNSFPGFEGQNPTCEVIAHFLFRELSAVFNDERVRVSRIEVSETPNSGAVYFELGS